MDRRTVLQISVAAAALPALAPGQEHAHPERVSERVDANPWKPQVFDDHQNQTVMVLTDLIIPATDTPGAKAVNTNRYIDLFLADGPDTERLRFLDGLAWLDGYALKQNNHPFVACTAAQQTAILTALDTSTDPVLAPGNRFFRMAKSMTASIYYATEAGFQELNKGGRVPGTFACKHPEHG